MRQTTLSDDRLVGVEHQRHARAAAGVLDSGVLDSGVLDSGVLSAAGSGRPRMRITDAPTGTGSETRVRYSLT